MSNIDTYDKEKIAQEVDKICKYFLNLRNISYFQFKRVYKNGTSIVLANDPDFFQEFFENGFIPPQMNITINMRLNSFCFWDETLSKDQLSYLMEKQGIYHGLTILNRRKVFYDCTTFAMSERHPSPVTYYLHILKDLQNFSELFPIKARHLIKESYKTPSVANASGRYIKRNIFFLPKRSTRFTIGDDVKNYITTYEALCMQLMQEGKSYKEIGSILSIASSTVKTHLLRLKARTGLSLQEISMLSFQTNHPYKTNFVLKNNKEQKHKQLKKNKKV